MVEVCWSGSSAGGSQNYVHGTYKTNKNLYFATSGSGCTATGAYGNDYQRPNIKFSTQGNNYNWSTDAGNGTSGWSAATNEDITVTNSAAANHAGTYTLTATNSLTSCSAQDAMVVTIPTPTITTSGSLSTFTACNGVVSSEQNFSVSGSNLSHDIVVTPPSGYEVSTTSGSSFAGSVTLNQSSGTVNATTIYIRTTTGASDGDGGNIACTSTNASTVNVATGSATINSLPSVNAGSDVAHCTGSSSSLSASGASTYSWSPSTGLSATNLGNPTANHTSTTTYTVTGTDANGCVNTDDIVVTVNSLPTANAGSDASHCSGASSSLSASGGSSYYWSPSTGLSATNVANPTASHTSTTTYTVTATDGNGCTDTDDIVALMLSITKRQRRCRPICYFR